MAKRAATASIGNQISLLVITKSQTLRELLRKILKKNSALTIEGVAVSGPEARDMLNRICPDVVLLDSEIVYKRDMSLLQFIMSHQPAPTIILSSKSRMGLKKSFDALQKGAVDFIWKDSIHENKETAAFHRRVLDKVICASKMDVTSFPVLQSSITVTPVSNTKKLAEIVFCEECGAKNIFEACQDEEKLKRCCNQCGDLLKTHLVSPHKRTDYVTVVAAGAGSYSNLLKIISRVPAGMSGAVIIVLYDDNKYVDTFTNYLDTISSIKVIRAKNGISIEGGNCYVATASENFHMKPYSTRNTIAVAKKSQGYAPVDLLMMSVSAVFKKNSAGLVLSGIELDGDKGLSSIKNNNGVTAVLYGAHCLHRQMGENVLRKCRVDKIVTENDAANFIYELHDAVRDSVSIA